MLAMSAGCGMVRLPLARLITTAVSSVNSTAEVAVSSRHRVGRTPGSMPTMTAIGDRFQGPCEQHADLWLEDERAGIVAADHADVNRRAGGPRPLDGHLGDHDLRPLALEFVGPRLAHLWRALSSSDGGSTTHPLRIMS